MSNNIQVAYEQVRKFNLIAGNLNGDKERLIQRIDKQLDFILSEFNETREDGFNAENAVLLLDGACDLFVTVAGFMQILEVVGFNVEKALARVNANNMTKFPETGRCVVEDIQPQDSDVIHTQYGHIVFRRKTDGKVLKPTNFQDVDLVSCVPVGFFDEGQSVADEPKRSITVKKFKNKAE